MKIVSNGKLKELVPSDGMYLATADKAVAYSGTLYLAKDDVAGNYVEITEAEYLEMTSLEKENE